MRSAQGRDNYCSVADIVELSKPVIAVLASYLLPSGVSVDAVYAFAMPGRGSLELSL